MFSKFSNFCFRMKEEIHKNIKFINNKFGDENWVPLQVLAFHTFEKNINSEYNVFLDQFTYSWG